MLPGTLVIFAVTLIVWTLGFLYFRNYLRRRTGSKRILEEFQEEVDKLIAEINNATDQGLTLMEDRITSLKSLLEETDRRISVYKRDTETRTMHDRAYAELGKKTVVKTGNPAPSLFDQEEMPLPQPESIPEKVDAVPAEISGFQSTKNAENNAPLSNEGPRFIRSSIRVEAKTPFTEQVLHLANAGFANELIAKNLGTSIAEVELVIALAERQKSESL
jgi:hypothetical protein